MAGCRSGQVRLLYIAPERLMLDNFLEHLANWNLAMLAVDDAHLYLAVGPVTSVRNMPRWSQLRQSGCRRSRLWR